MRKDDGGPAFPRPVSEDTTNGTLSDGNDVVSAQEGMSLRDYFASNATDEDLREFLSVPIGQECRIQGESRCVARYAFADMMLATKNKKG